MVRFVVLRLLLLMAGSIALATAATAATADTDGSGDPQALVRAKIEELRAAVLRDEALIGSDPNQAIVLVDQIVSPHVDTARSGRLILGKHWRNATTTQRQQFIDNFRRLLLRTYAVHVSDYADAEIVYLPSSQASTDGNLAVVRTRVTRGGKPPANVDYRMYQTEDGWKVFDVVVNGISIVVTFRSAIDAEIQQYGIDGLIARLIAKNQKPLAG
ncbi:MAG: MlaC/ttg2D family ABC transporter substrate-binding protein [Chromatiales bacterium]